MRKEFQDILNSEFALREVEGRSKLCSLEDAVSRQVKPGMSLHFPWNNIRVPSAAVHEIVRQFWGKRADFTIVAIAINYPLAVPVHGGLVKKIITAAGGDPYYQAAPCKVYQRVYKEKTVEFVNCSLLTLTQRLYAGAMGLPFMPSKSLIGSSIYEEDKPNIKIIDDPFESGQKLSLVKAIQPDLAIVHALAADCQGNAICIPPYGDNLYGALGSKNGILLTTEKIVSTDFIRRHPYLVKLPSYMVNSVSEVPFGAHPGGVYNPGIKELHGYAEDYEFFAKAHNASEDFEGFNVWIREWILDCKGHNDYLKKLGHERVRFLKGKSHSDSWRYELESISDSLDPSEESNSIETMIVVASRKLVEGVKEKSYRTILAGGGMSHLVAAVATYILRREQYDIDMMMETGLFGALTRPTEPHLLSHLVFPTCKMLTDTLTMLGIFMGGATNKCIASLAAAEIDKCGNMNTTRKELGKDLFIGGSGGHNDICSAAQEVVVNLAQSRSRFVDKVSYVTSPGDKVKTLISTLGTFEKLGNDNEFSLTGYFPNPKFSAPDQVIANIKENCGWNLKVSPNVVKISPPEANELRILRLIDAHRYSLGKQR